MSWSKSAYLRHVKHFAFLLDLTIYQSSRIVLSALGQSKLRVRGKRNRARVHAPPQHLKHPGGEFQTATSNDG